MKLKILDVEYHRNGVGGAPFTAIIFEDRTDGEKRTMIASLFEEPYYCAVYDLDLLDKRNIKFGENSWRGDNYEEALRPLLKKWEKKHGNN